MFDLTVWLAAYLLTLGLMLQLHPDHMICTEDAFYDEMRLIDVLTPDEQDQLQSGSFGDAQAKSGVTPCTEPVPVTAC